MTYEGPGQRRWFVRALAALAVASAGVSSASYLPLSAQLLTLAAAAAIAAWQLDFSAPDRRDDALADLLAALKKA